MGFQNSYKRKRKFIVSFVWGFLNFAVIPRIIWIPCAFTPAARLLEALSAPRYHTCPHPQHPLDVGSILCRAHRSRNRDIVGKVVKIKTDMKKSKGN